MKPSKELFKVNFVRFLLFRLKVGLIEVERDNDAEAKEVG